MRWVFAEASPGIEGLTQALRRLAPRIELMEVADVRTAALSAAEVARRQQGLGVCAAATGAGLLEALRGPALRGLPLLALTGSNALSRLSPSMKRRARS